MKNKPPVFLVISGFDPSNLAGYGRDIRVAHDFGVHPVGVITALTCQVPNTVQDIYPIDVKILKKQMELLFSYYSIQAIKIGMVYNQDICRTISTFLDSFSKPIVVDPLIQSTVGPYLLERDVLPVYQDLILKKASLITPNILEAQRFVNSETGDQTKLAKEMFSCFHVPVLIKGGHLENRAILDDTFYNGRKWKTWRRKKVTGINTHGSGCLLSSAIAASLAQGKNIQAAIDSAEKYISRCFKKPVQIQKEWFL